MSRADEIRTILSAVEPPIFISAREAGVQAVTRAFRSRITSFDSRYSVILSDNAIELLFKGMAISAGRITNEEVDFDSCANTMADIRPYVRTKRAQYDMLHEMRNRAYHHGDTPSKGNVLWGVRLMADTFLELDAFDPIAHVFSRKEAKS